MKWLLLPLLWALAVIVALVILWRWWHGRNVVLRGRWSPRFVRMVAVVLVVLGVGGEKGTAAPVPASSQGNPRDRAETAEPLPATITVETVQRWLLLQQAHHPWGMLKQSLVMSAQAEDQSPKVHRERIRAIVPSLPPGLQRLVLADLEEPGQDAPPPPRLTDLVKTLEEMEPLGFYDHYAAAYLWRKSERAAARDPDLLAQLTSRLHRHARVTDTLIQAQARIKPIMQPPRAWMGKGGRPPGWVNPGPLANADPSVAEMLGAAKVLYAQTGAGTWERDGFTRLNVSREGAGLTLVHAGRFQPIRPGETIKFCRLDLLQTPVGEKECVVTHAWLGELALPAGCTISVWELPEYLSEEGKTRACATLKEALEGSETAAVQIERSLPLTHELLREAVKQSPNAKGAARLRMILCLFDDTVAPGDLSASSFERVPQRGGGGRR